MKNSPDMEWFQNTYRETFQDISGVSDWKMLSDAAIFRKHTGDIDGAIQAMVKAIGLTRETPNLLEETVINLNYLAADLYLPKNAIEQAEVAIREAVELSRFLSPGLFADNLLVLATVLNEQGEHGEA